MILPLSWLKEYVDIKMPFKDLAEKLSEAGLTIEKWEEKDGDIIFDPEVTPNRPDWLSVYGVAREIAAVTSAKLKPVKPELPAKSRTLLPIKITPNYKIVPRITSVTIKGVAVKPSPEWLQKRIKQIGLRPINNLVDITNYVLWLYGGLLHVFDYDEIHGAQMTVTQAKGGEDFRSLDGLDYKLPKDAIIIKDADRIIDLLPLKGGENTSSTSKTKNVLLHSVVVDPVLTRRTSQFLGLRSDSSAVAEKGLDPNSPPLAVSSALKLILELAGGEVASQVLDHQEKEFKPWTVSLSHQKLEDVLGLKITPNEVKNIYERLELKVTGHYKITVPTFRNDLHIEEDLIEEIGRIYGYNKFPKILPASPPPTIPVAYGRNYNLEDNIKQTLAGFGFDEIYTFSLVSEDQLIKLGIDPLKVLRVDNPISKENEYLRPKLLGNLLEALKLNEANFQDIKIFELGKIYVGESVDKRIEKYSLSGIIKGNGFLEVKGIVEALLRKFGLNCSIKKAEKKSMEIWDHPDKAGEIVVDSDKIIGYIAEISQSVMSRFGIKGKAVYWELDFSDFEKMADLKKKFQPIPKYPAIVEDLSVVIPTSILFQDIFKTIKETDGLIKKVELIDVHESSKTFRLTYLNPHKNLTGEEVALVKEKIIKNLERKFGATLKG